MLLQITDPNDEHEVKVEKFAIGIDLGTTNCVTALTYDDQTTIIPIENSDFLPSVLSQDLQTIGHGALQQLNAIHSAKRFMNRPAEKLKYTDITPVDAAAALLNAIRKTAIAHLKAHNIIHNEVLDAVITVPAYFDETQRQATKDAAKLANLNVLRLLNEPTAAAVAYGLDHQESGNYLVFDLGGGTFDISLLKLQKGIFRVLATNGDTHLGGDDFDRIVCEVKDYKISTENLLKARKIKENLINHPTLQESFIEKAHPLYQRMIKLCNATLQEASLTKNQLQGILCVGGATRTYGLKEALRVALNVKLYDHIDPDRIVAIGAAQQAYALMGHRNDHVLMDVTPLSLGIETMGGIFEKIIDKNSPLPIAKAQEFTTYQDGQTALKIHVLQGEREMVTDNQSLANFSLKGIPAMPAGLARIQITFRLDADGILTVEAIEKHTGIRQIVEIKPSYGLTADKLKAMVFLAFEHAEDDMKARLLQESIVQADHLIRIVQNALQKDGFILAPTQKKVIDDDIEALRRAISQKNRDIIAENYAKLSKNTQDFAEKRIESAIKAQIVGDKLGDE